MADSAEKQEPTAIGAARDVTRPAVMQRENERGRVVVEGRRTDDGDRCTLIVIHESGGTLALYPHGWARFGVRLTKDNADVVVQAIRDSGR